MDAVFGEGARIARLYGKSLQQNSMTEPFREHLPLGSSLELTSRSAYPPQSHALSGRTNRSGWLSRVMGRTREGSRYKPLLKGEDEEEELQRLERDAHVIGDDEEVEEEEVRRRSSSVQCSRQLAE